MSSTQAGPPVFVTKLSDADLRKIKRVHSEGSLPYVTVIGYGNTAGALLVDLGSRRWVVVKYRALLNDTRRFRYNNEVKIGKKLLDNPTKHALPIIYSWKQRGWDDYTESDVEFGYVVMPYGVGLRLDELSGGNKTIARYLDDAVAIGRKLYEEHDIAVSDFTPSNLLQSPQGHLIAFDYDDWLPASCKSEDVVVHEIASAWGEWLGYSNQSVQHAFQVSQTIFDATPEQPKNKKRRR